MIPHEWYAQRRRIAVRQQQLRESLSVIQSAAEEYIANLDPDPLTNEPPVRLEPLSAEHGAGFALVSVTKATVYVVIRPNDEHLVIEPAIDAETDHAVTEIVSLGWNGYPIVNYKYAEEGGEVGIPRTTFLDRLVGAVLT